VEKAVKAAHKAMFKAPLRGTTLPHRVVGRFGATRVVLLPATRGTGVIAGRGVRDVMIAAGVADVLTKVLGSTNATNVVKATLDGLKRIRPREVVSELRGVAL
jgi:small subunit ribosomal protein S5